MFFFFLKTRLNHYTFTIKKKMINSKMLLAKTGICDMLNNNKNKRIQLDENIISGLEFQHIYIIFGKLLQDIKLSILSLN